MSCTIGAPVPSMYSSSAGASGGPVTSGGGPGTPTGALEGAVAGSRGGAVSSTGGGGTAVAGAAGALGSEQLMPVLEQLTAAIQQLTTALQPATQAPASPPADAPLNSNTAGVSGGGATTPTACGCAGTSSQAQGPQEPATEPRAPRGANAAPQAAAAPPAAPPPADVSRWVTGDTNGLDQDLLGKLAQLGERMGQNVFIKSGNRTYADQEKLYKAYLNGTGNKAARPGTSNHEHGDAADAQIGGKNLASNPKALEIATELGLHFPVRGEPWHVEVK